MSFTRSSFFIFLIFRLLFVASLSRRPVFGCVLRQPQTKFNASANIYLSKQFFPSSLFSWLPFRRFPFNNDNAVFLLSDCNECFSVYQDEAERDVQLSIKVAYLNKMFAKCFNEWRQKARGWNIKCDV